MVSEGVTAKSASIIPAPSPAKKKNGKEDCKIQGILILHLRDFSAH